MKLIKTLIRRPVLPMIALFALLLGSFSVIYVYGALISGPVIAYDKLNCEGTSQLFVSEQALQNHVMKHREFLSYHAEHSERPCINFARIKISHHSIQIEPNYQAFPAGSLNPSIQKFIAFVWNYFAQATCDCWREKADEKGVDYKHHDYKITVIHGEPTNENMGSMGLTLTDSKTINIYKYGIEGEVRAGEKFYPVFVQSIMHESIHAERFESKTEISSGDGISADIPDEVKIGILEEREVQEITYKRYKKSYGVEPPFSYPTLEEINKRIADRHTMTITRNDIHNLEIKELKIENMNMEEVVAKIKELGNSTYETKEEKAEIMGRIRAYGLAFKRMQFHVRRSKENPNDTNEAIPSCDD